MTSKNAVDSVGHRVVDASLLFPLLLYGTRARTLLKLDAVELLGVFERKVECKIFGTIRDCDDFHIRSNSLRYNNQRVRWLGHIFQKEEDDLTRRVFDAGISSPR